MAQYLREPLFVLDVDQHNDTHVQRYYYRDYSLPNGDIHETGCGGAMDDATAKTMLGHYARLHVLPVFMMLKHHEGHFNGVHHGDIAIKWHAEGDLDFTQANCRSHSWYEEVKAHIDYSQGLLAQVDYLNDDDATNTILIGAMERRARLDVIHDRLRLDTLDRDPYDIAILESGLEVEEERIHTLAGTGSYDAHPEPAHTTGGAHGSDQRSRISPQGYVVLSTLQRILNAINMDPELVSDRSKFRHLKAENTTAITGWLNQDHSSMRKPQFQGTSADFLPLMRWLTTHRAEMQSLLKYVPYPEIVAKMLPSELLLTWGALEVYDLEVATIRSVIQREDASVAAKEYCRTWLVACTIAEGTDRDRMLAKDPTRWQRLIGLYAAAPDCACPQDVREECWYVLHTLPHVVWAWKTTPWGGLPRSQLGAIFKAHPAVQLVRHRIVTDDAWGFTVQLPTGMTWEARMVAMAAGLAAPRRH
ncbi:hypothetical protein PF004_g29780 [Phytophthora fragariae]|uniref:Uncharacterized protein n=1 Tax=Phytophthora fragariae TaxID=53985 RepID=A0A6G0MF27_9STRA|nr:hypothetical protein PF004_g29780 [Phytophthora fragariae]